MTGPTGTPLFLKPWNPYKYVHIRVYMLQARMHSPTIGPQDLPRPGPDVDLTLGVQVPEQPNGSSAPAHDSDSTMP
jgi:hypothetical protein